MPKQPSSRPIRDGLQAIMIPTVPSFANKFFYSLGFLSAVSFALLVVTGTLMALCGPHWWIADQVGQYTRSVHLWATQAFVIFILLHITIVFLTSGFLGRRKFTWLLGVFMFLFALAESEFGYVLRGDFSSQYRSLQGSDFYNGSGLGHWINNLNTGQIFGIHVVVIPLLLIVLICTHYFLVRVLGIGKPSPMADQYPAVRANHWLLFWRGSAVVIIVGALAIFYPSPYLEPLSINNIAADDPAIISQTLVKEFDHSSDTATYSDNINPYTFDSRQVFIKTPYEQLISAQAGVNQLAVFNAESTDTQTAQLADATTYYADTKTIARPTNNPAVDVVDALTSMAKSGLYEAALHNNIGSSYDSTYVNRFLADTGVPDDTATSLKLTTDQYGMVHEETSHSLPPGAWWLVPIGLLNHTVLAKDDNGDRDAALIIGTFVLLMLAFPFIPYVNQLPSKLGLQKIIWLKPPKIR
ncbi:MAG TPA: cytochrome b N-terminal domain-containing protein [Candidatus Saccharimonadia bacterium]|nr:cytochrome b N-terminal domain-containing protein [Candidatus Saccharimonadia bacterium]